MRYAETEDVEAAFRELTSEERTRCTFLLEEAALIVDAYNREASEETKKLVCCRMVRRQLGDGDDGVTFPMGATQGTATALGYSQSWTMSGGTSGELYLSKLEKKLLGVGSRVGAHSPVEDLC